MPSSSGSPRGRRAPSEELILDDPCAPSRTSRDGGEPADARATRDCFKTPEGRYNLGKFWRTKSSSYVLARTSSVGTTRYVEYDPRCRRRVEVATVEGTRYVLVNAGDAVRVHEYNASTQCKATAKIRFEGECVTALAWRARDGDQDVCGDLLVGLASGEVCAVDVGKHVSEKARRLPATRRWNAGGNGVNGSRTTCVKWRKGGGMDASFDFVSLHADGSMYTYDSTSEGPAAKFTQPTSDATPSVVSSDVPGSNPSARWHFGRSALNAAAFSPDGRYLVVVNGAGMCRVLDIAAPKPRIVAGFKSYYAGFNAVAWSPCGRYVLAGGESDMIEIWGFYEREVVAWACEGHRSWITDIAVDQSEDIEGHRILRFASVGEDCRVALWDWHIPDDDADADVAALDDRASQLTVSESAPPRHARRASFFGPDVHVVQSAHRNQTERIVPIMTHKLHTSPVTAVRFTAEAVLTATLDSMKLWLRPSHPSRYSRGAPHGGDPDESDRVFP